MPTGNAKQTTLSFNTNNRGSPADDAINSTGGAHQQNDNDNRQISAAQKRPRNEFEDTSADDDANHLSVASLTSDGSAASLFSSESHATIMNANDRDATGP